MEKTVAPRGPVILVSDCTDVADVEIRNGIDLGYREAGGTGSAFQLIAPIVPCAAFSVPNASFLLRLLAESAPAGSLLMVIVNSISKRTERMIGVTESGIYFEGTNTGAFGWLVQELGCKSCYELHDPGFVPFGGKRVHAPAVGKYLAGASIEDLGRPMPFDQIRGQAPAPFEVLHVDNFGNAKVFAKADLLGFPEEGTELMIRLPNGHGIRASYASRMMNAADGTWQVYPGSSLDFLEIGQVRSAGVLNLGIRPGDLVSIERA